MDTGTFVEQPLVFKAEGAALPGVLALPERPAGDLGVLIVVGGPQYRVGSHRQFVHLARRLAGAGIPCLRFDVRGMGDADGAFPGFELLAPDLEAALAALLRHAPTVRRVVPWGLCDGASAILLGLVGRAEVAGLVLLNPWVRHAQTQAQVQVRDYYGRRIFDPVFWRKLLGGGVAWRRALRELAGQLRRALRRGGGAAGGGPQLYLLSGRDLVCAEFQRFSAADAVWAPVLRRPEVQRNELPEADHTFSSAVLRRAVEDATLAWLARLGGPPR
jgi:uncharacterized protein